VKDAGTVQRRETVGGSSGSSQLSPGRCSTEMISDGSKDTNGKVLVKGVGENLLPTAQTGGLCRQGFPLAAPGTGDSHIDLFGHLSPGQALITELQDLLCGDRVAGGPPKRMVTPAQRS
jgi:hypothetical protein